MHRRAGMISGLFPMPGSPPTSVTEPATRPPPKTRSNSATPVGNGAAPCAVTSMIGTGPHPARRAVAVRGAGRTDSATEPQVLHSVHRPSHFGDSQPHAEHTNRAERTDVRVMRRP